MITIIGLLVLVALIFIVIGLYKGERLFTTLSVLFLVIVELVRLVPLGR